MPATKPHDWHVLLIDDDEPLRRALARTIRMAGFEVDAFESAEALLAQGIPDCPACLVLDVNLPGIDGIALKRRLIAEHHDLPTIFITALAPEEIIDSLNTIGPVSVLYKPFDKEALLDAIAQAQK